MEAIYSPQSRAERLIASGRVVLACSSLFAVWLDPSEPAKYARTAYALLAAYVVYAVVIAVQVWRSDTPSNRHRLITHVFDLCFFSLFIYFTAGTASPFTAYFVFSLVCATLRWQWRGTLWTALVALTAFFGLGIYFSQVARDPAFEPYPLVVRGVYLAVVAVLLGYLGAHEERTRRDMMMLATWPASAPKRIETLARELLEHAGLAMSSPRAMIACTEGEEPWLYLGIWNRGAFTWKRMSPGTLGQLVAEPLRDAAFLCPDVAVPAPTVLRRSGGALQRWTGEPLDLELRRRFTVHSVLSLPFRGESVEGRLFFLEKPRMTSDDLVLGEIVAGVLCSRLDHFYLTQRLQETVATEERIRLSRDLHDGVLQSLTGIGLRLAAVRGVLEEKPQAALEGMEALQRLIALEQRDLRFFIQELKPSAQGPVGEARSLASRITELVHRIELEWGLRVDLRTAGLEGPICEPVARDIYHVVREALVNAVRHGEASAVCVEIARTEDDQLAVTVADNGRGFPFQGRYSGRELADRGIGPRTLLERVTSLQGTLALESSASGARLDIAVPCLGA